MMKYLKKALCLTLAALVLAGMAGCTGGGEEEGPDLDPAEMVRAMAEVDTTLPDMVTKSSGDDQA